MSKQPSPIQPESSSSSVSLYSVPAANADGYTPSPIKVPRHEGTSATAAEDQAPSAVSAASVVVVDGVVESSSNRTKNGECDQPLPPNSSYDNTNIFCMF